MFSIKSVTGNFSTSVTTGTDGSATLSAIPADVYVRDGLIAGVSFMQITTSLNLGHVLCFIYVLAGVRFFVMGDKNADYNAPQKARKRTQLVGVLFILGFICLLAAIFAELPVVLTVQAVYIFALALVLILAWKLSGKI